MKEVTEQDVLKARLDAANAEVIFYESGTEAHKIIAEFHRSGISSRGLTDATSEAQLVYWQTVANAAKMDADLKLLREELTTASDLNYHQKRSKNDDDGKYHEAQAGILGRIKSAIKKWRKVIEKEPQS